MCDSDLIWLIEIPDNFLYKETLKKQLKNNVIKAQ